jgi:hypothetical protein
MDDKNMQLLQKRILALLPTLNEYQRRNYLAAEADAIGFGGVSLVSRLSGVSRKTISKGIGELKDPNFQMPVGRSRKDGGGATPVWESQPGILHCLEELIAPHTKGDPERTLLWTNKSLRNLEKELALEGFTVSHVVVGKMLIMLGYSLQSNKKSLTAKPSYPDRNEQFEYINNETASANSEGCPVLSVDAKKKESIGNFKNNGRNYQPKGTPHEVLDHDFPIEGLGKAVPYGVYNIFKNHGFVNVGISHETAAFAVESIRSWWYSEGCIEYAAAPEIVLTADCGGSNGNRNRLWKCCLQELADEIEKPIRVLHYPPGTSKWNKIEHRLFSFISKNWQGIPLISSAVIVSLIGATRTQAGLAVTCVLDDSQYEKGIKVSDEWLNSVRIIRDGFHGEWNYRIFPQVG